MKIVFRLALLALIVSACVSKKKYAELEAQLGTAQTRSEIQKVRKTDEVKTADEYESQMATMQTEMDEMYQRMELAMTSYEAASGEPFDPSKAQKMIDERDRPADPFQAEDQGPLMQELGKQETRMRFTKQAFAKVAEKYTPGQMNVTQKGGKLIVSINKNVLFTGDENELSPTGETAVIRLAAAFSVQNDFRVFVMGVNEGSVKSESLTRAFNMADALQKRPELNGRLLIPSAISCNDAYGALKSCDRIEIVLEQNYDGAISTLRYEPKY